VAGELEGDGLGLGRKPLEEIAGRLEGSREQRGIRGIGALVMELDIGGLVLKELVEARKEDMDDVDEVLVYIKEVILEEAGLGKLEEMVKFNA
jgi:hypothetical protein